MKRLILPLLFTVNSFGAELTIKTSALESHLTLDATFIPTEKEVLKITPQQWKTFTIKELVQHGHFVNEGDSLIIFESQDYQRKLKASKEAAKRRQLSLAKAEQELSRLELETPQNLEDLKLAHDRAKETLDDFNSAGRALSEQEARERLESSKRALSYQEEELKQLLKMYREDGITEETEEIILKRQRASVKTARFALKKAQKSSTWALEKTIPNKGIDLARGYTKALQAYKAGQISLPRKLKEKKLLLIKQKNDHAEEDRKLKELQADAKFLILKAPSDGVIYYGEVSDHSWSFGESQKFLKEHGRVPIKTPLMTLIPEASTLALHGSVKQAERLTLPSNASGTLTIPGLLNSSFPTKITEITNAPDRGGQYRLSMSVDLPVDTPIVTGMKAKVTLTTFSKKNSINIPNSAITTKKDVSTVNIKMASGESETRVVQTGQVIGNQTEILDGLELGQVILVPDSPKK